MRSLLTLSRNSSSACINNIFLFYSNLHRLNPEKLKAAGITVTQKHTQFIADIKQVFLLALNFLKKKFADLLRRYEQISSENNVELQMTLLHSVLTYLKDHGFHSVFIKYVHMLVKQLTALNNLTEVLCK